MDFWGVVVEAGETRHVSPGANKLIHISQVLIGIEDMIPDQEVTAHITIGEEGAETRLCLAQFLFSSMHSVCKLSQKCDILLSEGFKLSHNATGPVHIIGYTANQPTIDAILERKIYVPEVTE